MIASLFFCVNTRHWDIPWNVINMKGVLAVNKECPCVMAKFPGDATVAMAYVPWHQLQEVYEPELALERGTLFPELDKPFRGGVMCRG